jgi:hypothetical protein
MSLAEPQIRLATSTDPGAVSVLLSGFSHTDLIRPTAEEAAACSPPSASRPSASSHSCPRVRQPT